jgi:uncharacterized membrane protein YraQ (UPF0718 family)/copper chaperone CopZ
MDFDLHVFASKMWETTTDMAPYLLFGFLVAGVLSIVVSPETVERQLGSRGLGSVIKAALFGVPLPLCSCGVIPVTASLRNHGASRGAATSFLISTPQTGIDSMLVTYSMLGPVFTLVRPIVSLVSGVLGGVVVDIVEKDEARGSAGSIKCTGECCAPSSKHGKLYRVFAYGFGTLAADIAKPLIVGIVLAGALSALVPEGFFAEYLGGGSFGTQIVAMLVMMLVGLPLYVCATASVPLAAAMIHMGVSPGAALVFLMTGPATNAASVATVWKVMGKRTAILYVATVAVSALVAGLVLNGIDPQAVSMQHAGHSLLPAWVGTVSAVVLFVILAHALLKPYVYTPAHVSHAHKEGHAMKLTISGMTCSHCAAHVVSALKECAGVEEATVDLKGGSAVVTGEGIDESEVKAKVSEAGYGVKGVEHSG